MADGSVTIAAILDTGAFQASIASLEGQLATLGTRMQTAVSGAVAAAGIDGTMDQIVLSMAGSLEGLTAMASAAAGNAAQAAVLQFGSADWSGTGYRAASSLAGGFAGGTNRIGAEAQAAVNAAKNAFTGDWSSIGVNMMSGIAAGVRGAAGSVIAAVSEVAGQVMAATKSAYQIQSPSAAMRDEVGVMLSRGIAEGILAGGGAVRDAVSAVGSASGGSVSRNTGNRTVNQNIYMTTAAKTPYQSARAIRRQSELMLRT